MTNRWRKISTAIDRNARECPSELEDTGTIVDAIQLATVEMLNFAPTAFFERVCGDWSAAET